MKIEFEPIGIVRSPFRDAREAPKQPSESKGAEGRIIVFERFIEGLSGLERFTHITLVCYLHEAKDYSLMVMPYHGNKERGLFATRTPSRPNPIGISVVRLLKISKNTIRVRDIDMIDGTPVLDLKPFTSRCNPVGGSK